MSDTAFQQRSSIDDIAYWQQQLYNHNDYIESLSRKRFHYLVTAEEAYAYVMEKLEADDYRRIRTFSGRRARFRTFLTIVVNRLLIDFRKKKYGDTAKPPKWIAACGGLYIQIFEMVCKEKCSVSQAVDTICDEYQYSRYLDKIRKRTCVLEVERIATEIITRIRSCRDVAAESDLPIDSVPESQLPQKTEDELILTEKEAIIKAIVDIVLNPHACQTASPIALVLEQFRNTLDLSSEDRMLLKTVYLNGYSVSKAARALGLENKKPHKKHNTLLAKVRGAFKATGIDSMIRSLLEDDED